MCLDCGWPFRGPRLVLPDECSHGSHPCWPLEALEPSLQCFLDFWKSFIITLQGVAATAD